MTADLPYMISVGNVEGILKKIRQGGTPPKFTGEFVKTTLGFTASQDRAFPKILKQLKFISPDGTPLPRYNEFKSATEGGKAMAQGLREGWQPIFMANQKANDLSTTELTDIFKTVTGQGESVSQKMATTFKAFAKHADWTAPHADQPPLDDDPNGASDPPPPPFERGAGSGSLSLHHDIHLHLPPTSDVAVYRAIFRALREELQ